MSVSAASERRPTSCVTPSRTTRRTPAAGNRMPTSVSQPAATEWSGVVASRTPRYAPDINASCAAAWRVLKKYTA